MNTKDGKASFVVEVSRTKYKRLAGYTCRGFSPHSVLLHLHLQFQRKVKDKTTGVKYYVPYYSESELEQALKKGQIRIICIGE